MMNSYQHLNTRHTPFKHHSGEALPTGKVVCVGRNYLDHVQELGNQVSEMPVLFIKPSTALAQLHQAIHIPTNRGECHNEVELAFLIGERLTNASEQDCANAIVGVGLALDLTLRDLQTQLKEAGQPWERAKAFDASCPVSGFVSLDGYQQQRFHFSLTVNGERRQLGDSDLMLHKLLPLMTDISRSFTLLPGDIVLTGTPKGVGALNVGDELEISLHEHFSVNTKVVSA